MALPNGSQIFIEQTRSSTEIEATAVSNAENPVATVASTTGIVAGDYVLVLESVWASFKNRVMRVKEVAENASLTLEGDKNTSTADLNKFPAGGASTLVKIEGWIEIPCVSDIAKSGGEQQFYTKQCLSDDREKQIPTFKSATSIAYTFDFDYANPITQLLIGYDEDGKTRAMRMFVPKASYPIRTFSGTPSFDDIPNTVMNEDETTILTISLDGKYTHMKEFV
jgi:hypothetical protein